MQWGRHDRKSENMYILNKIIGCLVSPVGISMALVAAAVVARMLGRRRLAGWTVVLALANFWVWSTPLTIRLTGVPLEAEFLVGGRVPTIESLPEADLIELHGGSMWAIADVSPYAEMWSSADRVWHAARLWKAGKAPKILVTSPHTDQTTGPLLADFGVPKEAIAYEFGSRNTEEEAKAVARWSERSVAKEKPRVLVVTSSWHMKRTMLMYGKYAPNVEAIPAACDWENTIDWRGAMGWQLLLPSPKALMDNCGAFHEWLGYFGYLLLRK